MYRIILTLEERQAIDWIGRRYFHGDDLYELFCLCDIEADENWDTDKTIEFSIPEHIAWEIKDGLEEEDSFCACFGPDLTNKFNNLIREIV